MLHDQETQYPIAIPGLRETKRSPYRRSEEPTSSSFFAIFFFSARISAVEAAAVEAAEPAVPEPVVKTLEDYLQEKAAKAVKVALPEARAANAGADDSQWKNAKVLEVEETGDFIKMRADTVAKAKKGKKEAKVVIKDIEVRYTEPAREPVAPRGGARGGRGGERGARGGARGARGAAAPRRGASTRGPVVDVADAELFPTLGSK